MTKQKNKLRLHAKNVSYQYGNGDGVHDINLTIGAGEIVALIGLNGAGKTTLLRLLLAMLRPSAGYIHINDVDIQRSTADLWRHVGYFVERPLAYPELTVRQDLELVSRIYGVGPKDITKIITDINLTAYEHRRISQLSLGNRQRVGIAAALFHKPSLVILDEPTNSLDPAGVASLRDTLTARAKQHGAGILVSSHHLDEVSRIADRILVMNAGRIIGDINPDASEIERVFFEMVRRDDDVRRGT